jgi:hypothetical protein
MFLLLPFVSVPIKGDALVKAIGFYDEPPTEESCLVGIVGHVLSIKESWMHKVFDNTLLNASSIALNTNPDDSSQYERNSSFFTFTKFIYLAYKASLKLAVKVPSFPGRFQRRFGEDVHQQGAEKPMSIIRAILIDFDNFCKIFSLKENYDHQETVDEICKTAFYAFQYPVMTDFFLNFPKKLDSNSFRLTIKSQPDVYKDLVFVRNQENLNESLQEASVKVINNRRRSGYHIYRAEMFRLALSMISQGFEEIAISAKTDDLFRQVINSWIQLLSYFRRKEEILVYRSLREKMKNEIEIMCNYYDDSSLHKTIKKLHKTLIKVLESLDKI